MKGQYKKSNINVTYRVPKDVADRLELITHDPVANRSHYGLKSVIVAELVDGFLQAFLNQENSLDLRPLMGKVHKHLNKSN
jgi:hypothetical protein